MKTKTPKFLTIGNRITQIRNKNGLSQLSFSRVIGISRSFLSELESGLTKPSMPILLSIEYKFGFRHEWILTGDEPIYPTSSYGLNNIMSISDAEKSNRVFLYWSGFLKRIFEEGDEKKIDAIKSSLRALDPATQKQDLQKKEGQSIGKKAM